MDLHEALTQITHIRQQMAQTETYRGYRAIPVAASGALAWLAALCQAWCLPEPVENVQAYLVLWLGVAALCVLIAGITMTWHCARSTASWTRPLTLLAVAQFSPCLVAGGLLTLVLYLYAKTSLWMLPGLWSILFSLGIFSSMRLLPQAIFGIGVFYLCAGSFCLALAQDTWALSPWAMALPFGLGQLATAAVLYFTLERPHGEEGCKDEV